ncbi:hypothetical protein J3P84_04260 [Pseudomonas sp. Z1-29]|uniref:Tc toxin subunit A-related protein n=1 Tax=Pseudomonas sp. Z1-29 TaxID=2817410 RepID=UPI003DA99891
MNTSIIPELEEQRRDALVAYYLGQVVPSSPATAKWGITTPEDLYEYLLIDNQVCAQVDTSRIAQGIASIQQYIHAIYNGMEPGYDVPIADAQRELWRNGLSEYSVWAGYQMIQDYPENYIDPTLRLGKTSQFQTLEMALGQSRLTHDSVQTALKNYLTEFEVVSNLNVVSGYIDGTDFAHADYYFIGRQTVEPFSHYWRKAAIDLVPGSTRVPPSAWSEWKKIDVLFEAKVTHVRGVVVDGRLHLVWVENGQPVYGDDGKKNGCFTYSIKMAYKQLNDMWSPATTLFTENSGTGTLSTHCLTAVMDTRAATGPRLVICLQDGENPDNNPRWVQAYDKFFMPAMDLSEKDALYALAKKMHATGKNTLQFPFEGTGDGTKNGREIDSIKWTRAHSENHIPEFGLNQSLELEAHLSGTGTAIDFMRIQGRCSESRLARYYLNIDLEGHVSNTTMMGIKYSTVQTNIRTIPGIDFSLGGWSSLYTNSSTIPSLTASFAHNGKLIGTASFEKNETLNYEGNYAYSASTVLQFDINTPLGPEAIHSGAGFVVLIFPPDVLPYAFQPASNSNSIVKRSATLTRPFKIHPYTEEGDTDWTGYLAFNGAAQTPEVTFKLPRDTLFVNIGFGDAGRDTSAVGYNYFTITLAPVLRAAPCLITEPTGGQFLDLSPLNLLPAPFVRLNSLFAKEFAQKAQLSLENVLSWETQHTPEPPVPYGYTWPPLDFHGANGRYLWEVFFHTPHLIAHRLHTEFDYSGAEDWLHYMFNPMARIRPLCPPPPANYEYWATRPLAEAGDISQELENPRDPDAIGYSNPEHYRKTIFTFYINNLIARGDMLYRQLTRDTLNEAKLHYVRALSLLGPLSKGRSISHWTPRTLEEAATPSDDVFAAFESLQLMASPVNVPRKVNGVPWLRLLDAPHFRLPVNTALLDLWDRLDLRLSNLRHNLTLDGKPLNLALYEPAANPKDLLRAQLAGGGSAQRRLGALANVPPYRFRAMLPRVQNAVETLIRFGDQVRGYMEQRDRATQEELQQSHVLELSSYTEALQEQAIEQSRKSMELLEGSRAKIESRLNYYNRLVKEDVSAKEKEVIESHLSANQLNTAASAATLVGHMLNLAPHTFGLATGGMHWGGPAFAISAGYQLAATNALVDTDSLTMNEQYRRRREEWQFMIEQSEAEMEELSLQINVQKVATKAAETSLAQAKKASVQAQEYFTFLKNRATGPALYQWLLSQMSTFYFQAYDVVLSLCLNTQDCWKYEIGDRDANFIPTNAWADNRFGLTAGENLKLGLLRMEAAFLTRHERRLELTKTVSLRSLLDKTTDADWKAVIENLKGEGKGNLLFDLKASTFDKDYPGHYLRQLVSVSVSIPGLLGPYQDLKIILTQQTSSTLMAAKIEGAKYLYKTSNDLPDEEGGESADIIFNPRAYQQIGISQGVDDRGLISMDFGDERYYPFEGTGAISSWVLNFPRHDSPAQQAILDSINDIIVHVRYLAKEGDNGLRDAVEALVREVEGKGKTVPPPDPERRLN